MTDQDGNQYRTVTIGTQTWMAENLRTTKNRYGQPIPNVIDDTQWSQLTNGAYCYFNHDVHNAAIYGCLYNFYAISENDSITASVIPEGWHIPTYDEWMTLINYLGGKLVAAGKLKEIGTTHWISPNSGATNESGFTAVPGGERAAAGGMTNSGVVAGWWTSTMGWGDEAYFCSLTYDEVEVELKAYFYRGGFSIRCVKDE